MLLQRAAGAGERAGGGKQEFGPAAAKGHQRDLGAGHIGLREQPLEAIAAPLHGATTAAVVHLLQPRTLDEALRADLAERPQVAGHRGGVAATVDLAGRTLAATRAHGKHLLVRFGGTIAGRPFSASTRAAAASIARLGDDRTTRAGSNRATPGGSSTMTVDP